MRMSDYPVQKVKSLDLIGIGWYLFFLFLLLGNISEHNIYSDVVLAGNVVLIMIIILLHRKVYYHQYFTLFTFFIAYHLFLWGSGISVYPNITWQSMQTMILNLGVLFLFYNFIVISDDTERLFKTYIWSSFFSLVIVMYILKDTLFDGRLGHAYGEGAISYYFLGGAVAMSNNGLATSCAIGFLFSSFFFIKKHKSIHLLQSSVLALGVILTGSRKGIMLLAIYFVFLMILMYPNKKIRVGILTMTILGIGYYLILEVPVLYHIAGERLAALLQNMLGTRVNDGSINSRILYAEYGIQEFWENPILGKGMGMFKHVYGNVTEINYLEMLVSGGVIGLILYYLYTIPLFACFEKVKHSSKEIMLSFLLACSVLIVDLGSVTCCSRKYLLLTVVFFALIYNHQKWVLRVKNLV